MKRLWIILCVALLLCGTAQAQKNTVFAGGEYDGKTKEFSAVVGGGVHLEGAFWLLPRTTIGEFSSLDSDLGLFFKVPKLPNFRAGLIAGPGVEWIKEEPKTAPISYITTASGIVIGWMPADVGIWAGAKYKFALDADSEIYQDGWQGGVWLAAAF